MDGETAAARVWRTGRPERVDSYEGMNGTLAARLRELGFRSAVAAPVTLGGGLWGAVIVSTVHPEPFAEGAEQRIADFAELAAQAVANAQARADLAASRARIVEAGDAERRRLERNLHDGAQQRLVSLSLNLRLAARRCADDPESRAAFERAGEELAQALEELRELARGIHPAILSDRGLEPAIQALAGRPSLPVEIDVGARLPAARAGRSGGLLRRRRGADQRGQVRQRDRGPGRGLPQQRRGIHRGDRRRRRRRRRARGSGLRGLCDRVEALGGRLVLASPPGVGTTLLAEIPV